MTLVWFAVWLLRGTPALQTTPHLGGWAIALALCMFVDIYVHVAAATHGQRPPTPGSGRDDS